ncbi:MAG: fibronectin type III domain-containing protein [Syntrophobacteraceae bacterium]
MTFTVPATGGSAITSYTVTSPSNSKIKATGKSTSIAVTASTSGESYTFQVYATNAEGPGQPSVAPNSVKAP